MVTVGMNIGDCNLALLGGWKVPAKALLGIGNTAERCVAVYMSQTMNNYQIVKRDVLEDNWGRKIVEH